MKVLDVEITYGSYDEIINKIFSSGIKTITCVNQHYLNLACSDENYKKKLQKFDLIHADGVGAYLAHLLLAHSFTYRVTGSDLYFKILDKMNNTHKSLYLYGDTEIVVNKTLKFIEKQYPNIKLLGAQNGYSLLDKEEFIKKIHKLNPYLIMVGLGAPRQEQWILENKSSLDNSKIIAVGGGFRVLSSDRKRGPEIIRNLGLEWLVRLIEEPKKYWKRYLIGIPYFTMNVLKYKYTQR